MPKTLIICIFLVQFLLAQEVPHQKFGLSKVNWTGTNHQEGGETRIGGYLRNPNTQFDWETLILPDLTNLQGNIDSMVVRIHAKSGQTGYGSAFQLYAVDQSFNTTNVNYDTFGMISWTELLGNQSVDFYTNDIWYEFRGPALNQLAANWQNGSKSNHGLVFAGNFWYFGYYMTIDDAQVLVYTSSNTQNDEIAQLLSFENFAHDWPSTGQLDEAIQGNDPTLGLYSLSLNHFGSIAPTNGLRSRTVSLPILGADIEYLLVDVKASSDAALTIKVRDAAFSTQTLGTISFSANNGQYQTIAFPISEGNKSFINQGDIQFEINVGAGSSFDIEADNLRFSTGLP